MNRFLAIVLSSLISVAAQAEVQTQEIVYQVGEKEFTG